ncbi:carbohydrate ABC transporter ATP-binding protein (CUT1 family) [Variovorax sp. 54]|uniref:ABC transporter ATP-binding protein n=1 Tax=Variovorax sp. 54 TaxID=2035212 RepID=UPI000C19C294|nr:sn-glycerol-3-phosphate ABC transporter ATP-binding protein UgpC [Variovorax sp. 54]PIF73818.1 carbohydrate ABC transporter ATP-binding protein (CUT1 family) [Variovorax sp. 54]
MAQLTLQGVAKSFGDTPIVRGVDLQIAHGEFCVLVGPSGCGKSTLLRLIAGLEEASGGSILIGGRDVTDEPPARRGIAMVFQSYALYPHMSVEENMGFGMKMAKQNDAGEIRQAVHSAAKTLRIDHLLARRPRDLSGGQRQRVAIGRAIVRKPDLFLFDEPLSNLDAALRVEMRVELAKLKEQLGTTFIYVTHDQVEAMTLADRIVVLRDGRIEQVGTPLELYHAPANEFVAGFIGSPKMNLLEARVSHVGSDACELALADDVTLQIPPVAGVRPGEAVKLGIRPEHLSLASPEDAHLRGRVVVVERLGSESYVHVQMGDNTVIVRTDGGADCTRGSVIGLRLAPHQRHLFNAAGQRLALRLDEPAHA